MLARGRRGLADRARVASMVVFVLSSSLPPVALAAPDSGPDLAAVDQGFRQGQDEFNRGDYIVAARTWVKAAGLLPETPEHRENRAGIYEYIADAYTRGAAEDDAALIREALEILDTYADDYAKTYPGQEIPAAIGKAQEVLRDRAAALQAARQQSAATPRPPPPSPSPAPTPTPEKPWKGLVIGGGVALGASVGMLALFGASLRWVDYYETQFNSPEYTCDPQALTGDCATWFDKGTSRDRAAVAGLVAAPVFLAAGAAMLTIGLRRKAGRHTVAPALGGGTTGATWRVRF